LKIFNVIKSKEIVNWTLKWEIEVMIFIIDFYIATSFICDMFITDFKPDKNGEAAL
jgi:hypothetical protein